MDQPLPEPLAGLVRDHRIVEEVVIATRKAIAAATAAAADEQTIATALDQARDFDAFAAVDLTLHIAKEEQVLFPAIRARTESEMEIVIDDMLAQHDEIREGNAQVRRLLKALDADHGELTAGTARFAAGLRAAAGKPSPSVFASLHSTVRTLDALLQGHFLDEEVNVFEAVVGWFAPEVMADLADRMAALESAYT
jgi:hemerythrin-like domain-containing protein